LSYTFFASKSGKSQTSTMAATRLN
jgi:hypothetical protein